MKTKKRVVVAMSGGVDSSLTAALLKQKGYDVIGVTMEIWPVTKEMKEREPKSCCSLSAVEDARRVANKLGIPYYVINLRDIFEKEVIEYFCEEYACGRTPNPCIVCNHKIKFSALLDRALQLDADYIATGHYAKVVYDEKIQRYLLKKADDPLKDQSYSLYGLTQEQLKHIIFPLGEYKKTETRKLAQELGLLVANKPDSQEICFITDNDYKRFLRERIPDKIIPGPIIDEKGKILGFHEGIPFYTIGQRKGLGLANPQPVYVTEIDPERNAIVVGSNTSVYGLGLVAEKTNYIPFDKLERPMEVTAKIRYGAKEEEAEIYPLPDNRVRVYFKNPVRAITPGQAVVFYNGDVVVGGGTIKKKISF
ncbi:MAG TPA: tRNA 2-thiouridine(34) synthase MnmA [Clostridia bacterium]|nr:tRNA 2-thiouridine(34) synthase MnmA [Clostridia bacterium]